MIDTNVKIDLCVDCLNCLALDILDNTHRFYSGDDPELVFGSVTCTHHLICPNIVGKEKISEIIRRVSNS